MITHSQIRRVVVSHISSFLVSSARGHTKCWSHRKIRRTQKSNRRAPTHLEGRHYFGRIVPVSR
ncbi:unnamed protein product, partial [Pylaiella littoralis]